MLLSNPDDVRSALPPRRPPEGGDSAPDEAPDTGPGSGDRAAASMPKSAPARLSLPSLQVSSTLETLGQQKNRAMDP
ncbi:hypothetical protein OG863_10930 [Streptomyces decoyicus]|uniref:Uncharacterized protein n=1 Tax=Streptomyces decoyicus TaxID=249567 RepID=A0ABZ1FDH7_9ACTN|nr:hypothetical protein [Streptomyces decoyicus]WSB68428.1 hypothetical protein OG863_10930 [Streptomyces decoyicus]